ncbi:hypothetical protein BWI93_27265 [Siphonobacter sp. BAB-5385]|uniref:hypothetical protein n=1 Tax=Siphonobacter sp. BAB-5385 TaxID=1864822 RepID=UPI000B9E4DE3|nr:hypothetical protein [Siphonobacter sp. BAB-5385]OZI05089.1 hypothetical protein BWI93_27265 [Siphonobacter sp. BAB-5385]
MGLFNQFGYPIDPNKIEAGVFPYGFIFIVCISYLLFYFKKKQQFWYGIIEAMFALFACWFLVKTQVSQLIQSNQIIDYVSIGSTVYLTVRGFSNISDGYEKETFFFNRIIKNIFD